MLKSFQANTDVLVGIKADIDSTLPDRPLEGRLEFFVDWYMFFKFKLRPVRSIITKH